MFSFFRGLCVLLPCIVLAGCETPEERAARETQFNGKPLAQVIAAIGQPDLQNSTTAVWQYRERDVIFEPIYIYTSTGQARVAGHRRRVIENECTYTARLSSARVVASQYVGNNCRRYAPRLPRA